MDGLAQGVSDVAGQRAGEAVRTAAQAVAKPVRQAAQFEYGVQQGVAEGAGSLVRGVGDLAVVGVRAEIDPQYRAELGAKVAQLAGRAGQAIAEVVHDPAGAAQAAGRAAEGLVDGVVRGGAEAAREGRLSEYIGHGVGRVGFEIVTTVALPEAKVAEAASVTAKAARAAELAGDADKLAETGKIADMANDAGKVGGVAAEAGEAGQGTSRIPEFTGGTGRERSAEAGTTRIAEGGADAGRTTAEATGGVGQGAELTVKGSSKPGVGDVLVGSSRSQMRRAAQKIIASDSNHPLKFLLSERGTFKPQWGLKHHELADRPDLVQMGHIASKKIGEKEQLMLQGAWENQYNNISIERSRIGGAVLNQTAIDIGGIAVDLQTAKFWEQIGLLKEGTIRTARQWF